MDKQVKQAIDVLKNGGIVIFPTDTAIGIGCRIDNESAVRRLFEIRKRPENKPVLALVNSLAMARKYWDSIPKNVLEILIKKYWPGPLTLILHSNKEKVPKMVMGANDTLGIRYPNNKMLLELIREVGVPIVAPSANFSGEKTPFRFEDLNPELVKLADYVLNMELRGEKNVSTVIDCTVQPWKVIRQGAVHVLAS